MALEDLLRHTVTLLDTSWTSEDGERVATPASVSRACLVQPMKVDARLSWGIEQSATAHTVYFAAPDPALIRGDLISFGAVTLQVLGPGRDQAGQGRLYAYDVAT